MNTRDQAIAVIRHCGEIDPSDLHTRVHELTGDSIRSIRSIVAQMWNDGTVNLGLDRKLRLNA